MNSKRGRFHFTKRIMPGILAAFALGSIIPTVSLAEEQAEPIESSEPTISIESTEPNSYIIHGTMTDTNSNPLASVSIKTGDKTATTDEEGKWEITDLLEGDYAIVASKDGYLFAPKDVTLEGEQSQTEVALEIVPEGNTVFGTIINIFSNPMADVIVVVGDKETITDKAGKWKITELSEGEHTVSASNPEDEDDSFALQTVTFGSDDDQMPIEDQTPIKVNVELITGYGTIKDKFREPIAGVIIRVYEKETINDEGLLATAETDEEGNWAASGFWTGDYTVVASKDDYLFEHKDCSVNHNGLCTPNLSNPDSVLAMTISAPETVVQGNNVTYNISVTNRGNQTASGIVVTDDLPKGTELVSAQVNWNTYYPVYKGVFKNTLSHCGSTPHTSPCSEATCNLPSLSSGGLCQNRSATVTIVLSNNQVETLKNKVTMTADQFPGDVQTTKTEVLPHFTIYVTTNQFVKIGDVLQYLVDIDLNPNVPDAATGVELALKLPNGVEFKTVKTDYGTCDTSNLPTITCAMKDISLEQANSLSHSVGLNVEVKDAGLLLLTLEATVKAIEYPPYTVRERTKIDIPGDDEIEVDMAFVIDITGSMQQEIDGVVGALEKFISKIEERARLLKEELLSSEEEEPLTSEEEKQLPSEANEPLPSNEEELLSSDEGEPLPSDEEEPPQIVEEPLPPLSALVVFGDTVKVKAFTRDINVLLEAVALLKAKGGGTCPEASVEALDFVIPYIKEGGGILFITDASPYPDADVAKTVKSITDKNIQFDAIITGDCSMEESWNVIPDAE